MPHDIQKIAAIIADPAKNVAEISVLGDGFFINLNNLIELDTIDDDEFWVEFESIAEFKLQKDNQGVRIFFKHRKAATYFASMIDGYDTDKELFDFLVFSKSGANPQ